MMTFQFSGEASIHREGPLCSRVQREQGSNLQELRSASLALVLFGGAPRSVRLAGASVSHALVVSRLLYIRDNERDMLLEYQSALHFTQSIQPCALQSVVRTCHAHNTKIHRGRLLPEYLLQP